MKEYAAFTGDWWPFVFRSDGERSLDSPSRSCLEGARLGESCDDGRSRRKAGQRPDRYAWTTKNTKHTKEECRLGATDERTAELNDCRLTFVCFVSFVVHVWGGPIWVTSWIWARGGAGKQRRSLTTASWPSSKSAA